MSVKVKFKMTSSIDIYTDGSCLGNPGRGGWAAVGQCENKNCEIFEICGKSNSDKTTNNIMELTAVIEGLQVALDEYGFSKATVITDSLYVKNGITQWVHTWKKHNWKTSRGSEVKNKSLWETLVNIVEKFNQVEWRWVKAHNGNTINEKVDTLARNCAGEKKNKYNTQHT